MQLQALEDPISLTLSSSVSLSALGYVSLAGRRVRALSPNSA